MSSIYLGPTICWFGLIQALQGFMFNKLYNIYLKVLKSVVVSAFTILKQL